MTETEDRIKLMIDAAYTTDNDGVILESNFWRVARDLAAEIDGLRAEIARLKPAAEAWAELREYLNANSGETAADLMAFVWALLAARAAKESRP